MARFLVCTALAASLISTPAAVLAQSADPFREDALSIDQIISDNYAYLDRFADGQIPTSETLKAEAQAVRDSASLSRYAERRLASLTDHHAITGSSFSDSYALIPSYSDLWIERVGDKYLVTAVREDSPADQSGIGVGDAILQIDSQPVAQAVSNFWSDMGLEMPVDGHGYAARVLAAGRRDRPRVISVQSGGDAPRSLTLPNLYAVNHPERGPVSVERDEDGLNIRINDSLGDEATIAAFDEAMQQARTGETIILDLQDTPSGGNTVIARAIMGWFVSEPRDYQIHRLISEERKTSIPRQWKEQVLPREGRFHSGPVRVQVGRWTGSMGEGLAVGLHALGAEVNGCPMAGLLGAIYDYRLEHSGLVIKLPAERLMTTTYVPRENFNCGVS